MKPAEVIGGTGRKGQGIRVVEVGTEQWRLRAPVFFMR